MRTEALPGRTSRCRARAVLRTRGRAHGARPDAGGAQSALGGGHHAVPRTSSFLAAPRGGGDRPMARIPISPRDPGPDHPDGPGDDTRLGGAPRVTTLTPGSAAALAALVVIGVYLSGSPTSGPARRGPLNEPRGRTRTLTFVAGGGVGAATAAGDGIRRWRVDAALRHSAPWGEALPGDVPAFSADGATVAVGDDSIIRLWSASEDRPRHAFRTGAGQTYALAFDRDGEILAAAS